MNMYHALHLLSSIWTFSVVWVSGSSCFGLQSLLLGPSLMQTRVPDLN